MKTTKYKIETSDIKINYRHCNAAYGDNLVLSNKKTDSTYNCDWYDKGFTVQICLKKRIHKDT
jgi:hypothetical protein